MKTELSLNEYQRAAADTDQYSPTDPEGTMVALLGLAGEAGSLLTLYKKYLRDGDAYQIMDARVQEEVGDILWYLARLSSRFWPRFAGRSRCQSKKKQTEMAHF